MGIMADNTGAICCVRNGDMLPVMALPRTRDMAPVIAGDGNLVLDGACVDVEGKERVTGDAETFLPAWGAQKTLSCGILNSTSVYWNLVVGYFSGGVVASRCAEADWLKAAADGVLHRRITHACEGHIGRHVDATAIVIGNVESRDR